MEKEVEILFNFYVGLLLWVLYELGNIIVDLFLYVVPCSYLKVQCTIRGG